MGDLTLGIYRIAKKRGVERKGYFITDFNFVVL